jgi:hypothetical protein
LINVLFKGLKMPTVFSTKSGLKLLATTSSLWIKWGDSKEKLAVVKQSENGLFFWVTYEDKNKISNRHRGSAKPTKREAFEHFIDWKYHNGSIR